MKRLLRLGPFAELLLLGLALLVARAARAGDGYAPASPPQPALQISGYTDVGFAVAQGDGTSFSPADTRLPADYGTDPFATAVNSRGDVASTDSHGRFTNGFLPRSMGLGGGTPSFFINTADLDVKYTSSSGRALIFTRLQILPRFSAGNDTLLLLEQAFVRVLPFDSQELALFAGKFDSVFGIEYLDNEANLRTGVTPSLIARYTTGQSLGLKGFFRLQLPALWSAVSVNLAMTNGGSLVETLSPPDLSLAGRPIFTGRLSLEVNLPKVALKVGASGMTGPRNDQHNPDVRQRSLGADARLVWAGLSLSGEFIWISQDSGGADKLNGLGTQTAVSAFWARGAYATLSYALPTSAAGFVRRVTPYARFERRHAAFEGFRPYTVQRITAGVRLDLLDELALKAEYLWNGAVTGTSPVENNVFTTSLVFNF